MSENGDSNSYGASRRRLGICYVGAIVTFCVAALFSGLAVRLFGSADYSSVEWFRNIVLCTLVYEIASLPFDLVGFSIERKFGKTEQPVMKYLSLWCVSMFKHGMLLVGCAFFFTLAAKLGGIAGVAISSVLATTFFTWKQAEAARFLSEIHFEEPSQEMRGTFVQNRNGTIGIAIARTTDSGFTGGIVGLPKFETLVIPANWLVDLSRQELWTEITRRNSAVECGSRSRGIIGAVAFVVAGVTIAASLTSKSWGLALDSTAGIVTTSFLFTMWSFLGLLFLPLVNQRGVTEADKCAITKGVTRDILSQTIRKIDANMENESSRSDAIQFIFHPIPTPERRLHALETSPHIGAWHIARHAIWLSLVGMGLLGRAVHCNAGRPELWCMLPAD